MITETLLCYGRTKDPRQFRTPVDVEEMDAHCTRNYHIWFRSIDGTARQAKVNGKVRRWKRDRTRIEVPLKYGLYEYGLFDASDLNRVLIPVDEADEIGNAPSLTDSGSLSPSLA